MGDNPFIRDFDPRRDAEALGKLDTSFTSDHAYKVTGNTRSLQLTLAPLPTPLHKRFSIALDDDTESRNFVAFRGDLLQGFVATTFRPWHRRLVVSHLYVDCPCRQQGVGRRLIDHALDYGRREGAVTAWIEVSNLNHPAVEAYLRLGFSLCGFDTTFYVGTSAEGEIALFLARPIA